MTDNRARNERFDELKEIALYLAYEAETASEHHPSFHSAHEGYAVIKEELEELWTIIKTLDNFEDFSKDTELLKEARQTGAMCIRFIFDLIGDWRSLK